MTEGDAMMSRSVGAGLEQRILHARDLLQHCVERLADYSGPHFSRAKVANLFYLEKVKKGIAFGGGYQSGFFPTRQLTRRDPKDTQSICSSISVHGCSGSFTFIIRKLMP